MPNRVICAANTQKMKTKLCTKPEFVACSQTAEFIKFDLQLPNIAISKIWIEIWRLFGNVPQ